MIGSITAASCQFSSDQNRVEIPTASSIANTNFGP